jgi:hypothetical protein
MYDQTTNPRRFQNRARPESSPGPLTSDTDSQPTGLLDSVFTYTQPATTHIAFGPSGTLNDEYDCEESRSDWNSASLAIPRQASNTANNDDGGLPTKGNLNDAGQSFNHCPANKTP